MSKMHKSSDKKAPQMTVHGGNMGKAVPPPSGYGVKGMTSVDKDACRESTAPTPASLAGRTA